ncbi:MAG: hypothetical protein Q9226_006565 [Calogaya cf. arnoldii]
MVTANLYSALTRISELEEGALTIWADAICINQGDLHERAAQVLIMPKIYAQATQVIVDIGEQVDDSEIILHLCANYGALLGPLRNQKGTGAWPNLEHFDRGEWGRNEWWSGLISLCSRPWFRRVWVVQEIELARSIKMLCGYVFFKWWDLATVIRILNRDGLLARVGSVAYRGCQAILTMEPHSPGSLNASILPSLSSNRVREATNPRDKVYAIMGIVADKQLSTTLGVDYSVSTEQVFEDIARYLLSRNPSIEILYEAGGPKNLTNLSSWAPDWTIGPQSSLRGYENDYNASGHLRGPSQPLMELDGSGRRLQVRGFIVDEIYDIGSTLVWSERPSSVGNDEPRQRISDFLKEAGGIIKPLGYHYVPKEGSTAEAFWRTLVGGKSFKDKSIPHSWKYSQLLDTFQQRFQSWYPTPPEDAGLPSGLTRRKRTWRGSLPYQQSLELVLWGRLFGTTLGRYMGLLPRNSQKGDQIAIIAGSDVPFVMRKGAQDGTFRLVGDCYVHGMMRGEMMNYFGDEFAPSPDLKMGKMDFSLVLV